MKKYYANLTLYAMRILELCLKQKKIIREVLATCVSINTTTLKVIKL